MGSEKGTVLVVDDDDAIRRLLRRSLERQGFTVLERAHANDLIKDVAETKCDLILLDHMMPGTSGMDALAKLREVKSDAELPVIMLTGRTGREDIIRAFRVGASDYLTKPPSLSELFDRVEANILLRTRSDRLLGQYRLVRRLGEGAMGTVFEAEDTGSGVKVALKVLHNQFGRDEAVVARLFDEARVLSQLDHPHIVKCYGAGEALDAFFLVLEFLEGDNLKGQRLDVPTIAAVGRDLCLALAYLHERGCVHRDIKPANVLRTPDGKTKLFDFGVARRVEAEHTTMHGVVVGTPVYMAPERFIGEETVASDTYSLGCLLFELVAGVPPFSSRSATERLMREKSHASPRLMSVAPDVPPTLDEVVAELMDPDPRRRPSDLLVVAKLLDSMATP